MDHLSVQDILNLVSIVVAHPRMVRAIEESTSELYEKDPFYGITYNVMKCITELVFYIRHGETDSSMAQKIKRMHEADLARQESMRAANLAMDQIVNIQNFKVRDGPTLVDQVLQRTVYGASSDSDEFDMDMPDPRQRGSARRTELVREKAQRKKLHRNAE